MTATTAAAINLRPRAISRWLGSVVLVIIFVAVILVIRYSATPSFDIVNASS